MTNFIVGIFGKKGSGKTTLAKKMLKKFKRRIVLDSMHEYETGKIFYKFSDLHKYLKLRPVHKVNAVFRPTSEEEKDLFFQLLIYYNNVVYLIEEVDLYCNSQGIEPNLKHLINYGRHFNRSLIYVARRPARVHKDLTSQSDLLISFYQQEPNDLKYFREYSFSGTLNELDPKKYEYAYHGEIEYFREIIRVKETA